MIITDEILEQGASDNGAWSYKQLKCLGVNVQNNSGWRRKLIGTDIPDEDVEEFLALKNLHLEEKRTVTNLIKENRKLRRKIRQLEKKLITKTY